MFPVSLFGPLRPVAACVVAIATAVPAAPALAVQPFVLKDIPVGRFCEPEEFAHVVRFLASPLAGFITGEIIDINGGLLMDCGRSCIPSASKTFKSPFRSQRRYL